MMDRYQTRFLRPRIDKSTLVTFGRFQLSVHLSVSRSKKQQFQEILSRIENFHDSSTWAFQISKSSKNYVLILISRLFIRSYFLVRETAATYDFLKDS